MSRVLSHGASNRALRTGTGDRANGAGSPGPCPSAERTAIVLTRAVASARHNRAQRGCSNHRAGADFDAAHREKRSQFLIRAVDACLLGTTDAGFADAKVPAAQVGPE